MRLAIKDIFTPSEIRDFNMTWAQVAEKMFINNSTVGAVEKRALAKLRKEFKRRNIKFEDLL